MDQISHRIASRTTSRVALELALSMPELFESAVGNPSLPLDLWMSLLAAKKKPSVRVAGSLVDRPLTPTMLDHVIATETRVNVLLKALSWADPSIEQLTALLANKGFTAKLAEKLIDSFSDVITVGWLQQAAEKVGGAARTEFWLRAPDLVTDDEVNTALMDYESWGPEWDQDRWAQLFATRPAALAGGARSNSLKVRTAAAGCRHLLDPALQRELAGLNEPEAASADTASPAWIEQHGFVWTALVCNPACDLHVVRELDPFMQRCEEYDKKFMAENRLRRQPYRLNSALEAVNDPVLLSWLVRRTVPSAHKLAGRPFDLRALLSNPHLSEGDAEAIFRGLREHLDIVADVREEFRALAVRYPAVAAVPGFDPQALAEKLARYDGPHRDATQARQARLQANIEQNATLPPAARALEDLEQEHVVTQAPMRNITSWFGVEEVTAYFDAALTPSTDAWFVLIQMLEAGSFAGTAKDLTLVVNATAS